MLALVRHDAEVQAASHGPDEKTCSALIVGSTTWRILALRTGALRERLNTILVLFHLMLGYLSGYRILVLNPSSPALPFVNAQVTRLSQRLFRQGVSNGIENILNV
jgi:hypothetical protein